MDLKMELPNGYNKDTLCEILEKARKSVEEEYGFVFLPAPVSEKLLEQCREIVKSYNSQVAFEEMRREIEELIKRW